MRKLLLLLLLVGSAYAQAERYQRADVDRALDALARADRLRGSVAVLQSGRVLYQRSFGPGADERTMYRVGSVTKVFTAAMILQLIEEKKLALDTPLAKFFPQIPNAERITIAHMLGHQSGIHGDPRGDEPWMYQAQTREAMVARIAATKPDFAPGERTSYSNPNFILLGYILESVTHSTYDAQLQRRIVRKLGLKRTRFGGDIRDRNDEVHSFDWDDGRWKQLPDTHWTVPAGAGAIASTPTDLATFITALFTNRLLKPSSIDAMLTGKGINVHTLGGIEKKAYSHLGGVDAFSANLLYIPEDGLAIAITLNGQNYPMSKLFWILANAFYGRPVSVPSFARVELPAATLDGYAGAYKLEGTSFELTVQREGDHLSARVTGQDAFPLDPVGDTMFSNASSGILVEMKGNSLLLYQGRTTTTFMRR